MGPDPNIPGVRRVERISDPQRTGSGIERIELARHPGRPKSSTIPKATIVHFIRIMSWQRRQPVSKESKREDDRHNWRKEQDV